MREVGIVELISSFPGVFWSLCRILESAHEDVRGAIMEHVVVLTSPRGLRVLDTSSGLRYTSVLPYTELELEGQISILTV